MSKLAEKLSKRIKEEFDIDVIPKIYRIRAGYWQRRAGAWSWFMLTKDGFDVGSIYRANDVLKAKKLSSLRTHPIDYQTEILIEEK